SARVPALTTTLPTTGVVSVSVPRPSLFTLVTGPENVTLKPAVFMLPGLDVVFVIPLDDEKFPAAIKKPPPLRSIVDPRPKLESDETVSAPCKIVVGPV